MDQGSIIGYVFFLPDEYAMLWYTIRETFRAFHCRTYFVDKERNTFTALTLDTCSPRKHNIAHEASWSCDDLTKS